MGLLPVVYTQIYTDIYRYVQIYICVQHNPTFIEIACGIFNVIHELNFQNVNFLTNRVEGIIGQKRGRRFRGKGANSKQYRPDLYKLLRPESAFWRRKVGFEISLYGGVFYLMPFFITRNACLPNVLTGLLVKS